MPTFTTHLYKDICGELNTPGPPSSFWEPYYSCSLRAGILKNMVPKASVQVG